MRFSEEEKMWRILKAEIIYNRILLIVSFMIAIPALFISFIWDDWAFSINQIKSPAVVLVHHVILWAVLFLLIGAASDKRNSKRVRLHAQLMLPIRQLGMIYVALPILFWFSIVFLIWMIYLIGFPSRVDAFLIWQMVVMTGFIFIAASGPLFYDLNYLAKEKSQKLILNILGPVLFIALLILYFAAILPPVMRNISLSRSLYNFLFSPLGATILILLGIVLIAFGVIIVAHRKSYTE